MSVVARSCDFEIESALYVVLLLNFTPLTLCTVLVCSVVPCVFKRKKHTVFNITLISLSKVT